MKQHFTVRQVRSTARRRSQALSNTAVSAEQPPRLAVMPSDARAGGSSLRRSLLSPCCQFKQAIEDGEGDTWPPSAALPLITEEALRDGQLAFRRGLALESPQNEAMKHQGERDSECGYHHQRIG